VARLEKSVDRNGNTLRFLYDQHGRLQTIFDTLDRPIQISYTPDNFISSVTDFTGRRVAYEHYGDGDPDGRRGGLKAVISPQVTETPNANDFPDGKRTTYTYIVDPGPRGGLRDNLLTLTDGRRNDPSDPTYGQGPYLVNQYSPANNPSDYLFHSGQDRALRYDRVLRQRWGQGTFDIYYEAFKLEPEDASKGSVGTVSVGRSSSGGSSGGGSVPGTSEDRPIPGYGTRTLVRDRVGNVLEYIYDGFGHCRQFIEFTGRSSVGSPVTYTANRPTNQFRADDPAYYVTDYGNDRQDNQDRIVHPKGNAELKVYAQASRANRNLLSRTR
jgi:YD repeat-containing protein